MENKEITPREVIFPDRRTLEEVIEVCKNAYIHDYIMSLPNQYETIIGEGGVNLSYLEWRGDGPR